ncbi:IST1 homolog [Bacillus rossius redtenbacheri]|uniref:IST1 homolog n=1 Tax=Bacillus rossius redtenbacheri TaxID=93214 RepID=UPI002FDE890F
MFFRGPSYSKLKTNLKLAVNRLKLLKNKKIELAERVRKEIADNISSGKMEIAKIKVRQIIEEDYMVEAIEIVESYCAILLTKFGLLQQMKTLDDSLSEAVSSLLWVSPKLQSNIPEMIVISDMLTAKYGKKYARSCREDAVSTMSQKLKHKISMQSIPKILIEKYMAEIAKKYNLEYEPDPQVINDNQDFDIDTTLVHRNGPDCNKMESRVLAPQPASLFGLLHPLMQPLHPPSDFIPDKCSPNTYGGSAAGFVVPQSRNQQPSTSSSYDIELPFNISPSANNLLPLGFDGISRPFDIDTQHTYVPSCSNFAPEINPGNKKIDDISIGPEPVGRGRGE